ncbi:hypothetical protein EYR36_001363 [Pleurotus pulmonarius]|nr:hypothetical protein EYR36_001363 [Pleurotus pulmonarius]
MAPGPNFETIPSTVEAIRSQLPDGLKNPRVGIVCGSGLSGLAASMKEVIEVAYDDIPGFAKSTVTNAAGALNPEIKVGTVVVVRDHLALPGLAGMNPLLGPTFSSATPRFLPVSDAYSPALRRLVFLAANELSIPWSDFAEGTYAWVSGPTYETPAEGRFLRAAGADMVGMSTVPEVLAAREAGVGVLVLSLATNMVVIPEKYRSIKEEVEAELLGKKVELPVQEVVSHEEVLFIGRQKGDMMKGLVEKIIDLIPASVRDESQK